MNKYRKVLSLIIGIIFILSVSVAFAGDKSNKSQHSKTKATKQSVSEKVSNKNMNQEKKGNMEQKQEMKEICFKTKDGKTYRWNNAYNKRLMRYEEKGNEKKMHRYLYRIAKRLGITDPEEIDEFIEWALQNKPWLKNDSEQ